MVGKKFSGSEASGAPESNENRDCFENAAGWLQPRQQAAQMLWFRNGSCSGCPSRAETTLFLRILRKTTAFAPVASHH